LDRLVEIIPRAAALDVCRPREATKLTLLLAVRVQHVETTSSEIRIGVIADVNTPVAPGLFQQNVNVVKAWAGLVNASGGLAGRKVVVDVCDSKLDPNATANCVIQACQNDFALVGTAANALNDISRWSTPSAG
jgi:ABC-type branched-subunit amino acid transport system substrate-binding protein